MTKALQTNCLILDHNSGYSLLFQLFLVFWGSQYFLGHMELAANRSETYEDLKGQIFNNTGITVLVVLKVFLNQTRC